MAMTLEDIRILSKGKNQDYKDGWNDATRMCNMSGLWCPSLEGLVFDENSDDYRAGYFKAYEALEGFIGQTMNENQRLREIQQKHEDEKEYIRKKEKELDVLVKKADMIDKIAECFTTLILSRRSGLRTTTTTKMIGNTDKAVVLLEMTKKIRSYFGWRIAPFYEWQHKRRNAHVRRWNRWQVKRR